MNHKTVSNVYDLTLKLQVVETNIDLYITRNKFLFIELKPLVFKEMYRWLKAHMLYV